MKIHNGMPLLTGIRGLAALIVFTGNCCFFYKKLTDERSAAVGYGKKCAQRFGIKWGNS